jgi:hypothetical protein
MFNQAANQTSTNNVVDLTLTKDKTSLLEAELVPQEVCHLLAEALEELLADLLLMAILWLHMVAPRVCSNPHKEWANNHSSNVCCQMANPCFNNNQWDLEDKEEDADQWVQVDEDLLLKDEVATTWVAQCNNKWDPVESHVLVSSLTAMFATKVDPWLLTVA